MGTSIGATGLIGWGIHFGLIPSTPIWGPAALIAALIISIGLAAYFAYRYLTNSNITYNITYIDFTYNNFHYYI